MKKSTKLLLKANRLGDLYREAGKVWKDADSEYRKAYAQEYEESKSPEERALEAKAKSQSSSCGCICGCRSTVMGSTYKGSIYFGRCMDCVGACS